MGSVVDKHHYRLKVPDKYGSIVKWVESQVDLSTSLILLISEEIKKNGYNDVLSSNIQSITSGSVVRDEKVVVSEGKSKLRDDLQKVESSGFEELLVPKTVSKEVVESVITVPEQQRVVTQEQPTITQEQVADELVTPQVQSAEVKQPQGLVDDLGLSDSILSSLF